MNGMQEVQQRGMGIGRAWCLSCVQSSFIFKLPSERWVGGTGIKRVGEIMRCHNCGAIFLEPYQANYWMCPTCGTAYNKVEATANTVGGKVKS